MKIGPIGGTAQVRVGDRLLRFRSEMTYNFQVFKKTGVAGGDGAVHGYTQEAQVPYIEMEVTQDGTDMKTRDWEAIDNAIVNCALANGVQLVLRGAYVAGDIVPDAMKGSLKVRFEGTDGEEV